MTFYNNDHLSRYVNDLFVRQDDALQRASDELEGRGLPAISINPEEGRFLQVLVRARNTRKALEIGTLGGYSGIWIARGLAPGGKLITIEKEERHAQVARDNFNKAGVSALVDLRVGDAHELIRSLGNEGPFDFIFIDAEKPGYVAYVDWAVENVPLGGVIAAHNAFSGGRIFENKDEYTNTMQAFNRHVAEDKRLISTIYPAGDGTVIAVRVA